MSEKVWLISRFNGERLAQLRRSTYPSTLGLELIQSVGLQASPRCCNATAIVWSPG